MHYGDILEGCEIDHINGDTSDNRLENLRCVTRKENALNQKLPRNNTSGHIGVSQTRTGRWSANFYKDNQAKRIGPFATKELACEAWQRAAKELGYHENHGR